MRFILAALALIVLNGCTLYTTRDGWYAGEFDTRECRADAKKKPGYPAAADAFTPGGMDRAAVKIEQMTDDCMARKGYKPAA